ncbi:Gfo/Idh/MocA family protein [Amycolatopsis sp. CA-128772]|uniref:Gfo/Idh/MocA family protein n=1 Tax=Amycolatopsis sp. CA-128772 TaxID=2073159 RepID=UPI000CD13B43|nr:Gfo/Idh/MocA family oxidoreductase [Amycolatopsis sp. CA-128772]
MKVAILSSAPEVYAEGLRNVEVIATAGWDAFEPVLRAAEAGARVLCEYPSAAKEADLKAIVDAGGDRLTFASPACHGEAFTVVRRGIADGGIGELTTILGSLATNADGGVLGAAAPHLLDLADAVLGGEPAQQVYAQTNTVLNGHGAESASVLTVRYRSGKVASFDLRRDPAGTDRPAVTFIGDKASVQYDAGPKLLDGVGPFGGEDLVSLLLRDFLSEGDTPGPDGEAALRTFRIVQAAYESAQTGQPVDLA